MSPAIWYRLAAVPALAVIASPAAATDYLTVEQAQHVLFPQAQKFEPFFVTLTHDQLKQIHKRAGTPQRNDHPRIWRAVSGGRTVGWMLVDDVIGKHDFITYATAISPDGHVLDIEIMSYRESKGGQVRNARWRAQFNGKSLQDRLRLGRDIANISGATLSCRNITDGVKRLLVLYSVVLAHAG